MSRKDEKSLRGVAGLTILDTVKAGVRFTSKRLALLAEGHAELSRDYEETSSEIVQHILSVAGLTTINGPAVALSAEP